MARVPDLGSDFAQKLLLDLRRRRERLGFGSAAAAQQQQQQQRATSSAAAATRDARSGSQKPLRSQKPQQAAPAPRARAPEAKAAPTRSSQQQPGNAIPTAGKPRRRRDVAPVAAADARAIVPYQGGGGGGAGGGGGKPKHVVASNVDVQRMAALALALSDGGKLRNIKIMARDGSVFLRAPDTPAHRRGGGAGAVAIGVQDLNDMLMAAYSSGVHSGRRRSDGAGEKRLFRGSMDMEEALSMLVMLQDASGYVEGSGSGKVLLLKDKENRESSATTTRGSARIVEIVDEESETEEASKNASMQIVVHDKFVQSHDQSPNSSSVMQSGPTDSKTSNGSQGEKDGSKVRMPSVIAKLMGLENLPSSAAAKTVVERKGTERFVKSESVPRMEIRANAMDRKLPIRIVASEKVLSKGQDNILLPGEWKSSSLTDFGEPELPNSPSCPATGNKHVRLTMRDVLRKMVGSERGDDGSQGVDERIIHEDKTFTEEIKLQKPVSVGCRSSDSGKKMDFLKRFRKNSDNKPAIQEKHTTEGKSTSAGKKQATGMKRLLGRDSEAKSRREREKLNKENQATAQTKVAAAGKNGKADQMKRQSQQSKHMDRQTTPRKARNCRETQRETPSRNLEDKKALTLKAAYVKKKPGYAVVIQPEDEEHAEVSDISSSKPSGSGNFPEELAIVVRGSSTAGGEASSYKTLQKTTEATSDLTISVQSVVRESEDSKFLDQTATSEIHVRDNNRTGAASSDQPLQEVTNEASVQTVAQESESLQLLDQSPIAEINAQAAVHASEELKFMNQSATSETYDGRINHTATETTRIPETFAEEEHQQQTEQHQHQQQQMTVKEQPTDGPDQTTTSTDSTGSQEQATHVVSCDSFTENQLLLVRMLVKDRYLLETAKAIVRVHDPVSFVDDDDAGARSRPDKGNSDLLPDVAREVIRRKGKRSEAMEGVSVARAANPKLRCLDDLVRELDGVVESLDISKKLHRQSDSGAAEGLQMILRSDIQNDHPDANSTWDFGWNRVWGLPIEKNEVVRDLEKNILGGIITDVARDLIGVAVRHGCCGCVA